MLSYNLFLQAMSGFGRYKPCFNVFFLKLVTTGFLWFFSIPVRGPCVLKLSRTGPGPGPSKKKKKKTGTGDAPLCLCASKQNKRPIHNTRGCSGI
jgi:hypothetical protein